MSKTSFRYLGPIVTVAAVLLGAVLLQVFGGDRPVPLSIPRVALAIQVPTQLVGWVVSNERLDQIEVVNEAVLKTLNLDDYVCRRFRKGITSFTVYAAYWAAGRMPARLVAAHTPDRCWTQSGMRCVEMRFRRQYLLGGKPMMPAEYRVFTSDANGEKTFVAYWHIVDGKCYDFGNRFNAVPHPWLWWKDVVAQAAHGSGEQLFVRIASNQPLEGWWLDPDFQVVMTGLADLGLWNTMQ